MVVDYATPDRVGPVEVFTNPSVTYVSLSLDHATDGTAYLTPDEAQDVALYLLRNARLVEKGSG